MRVIDLNNEKKSDNFQTGINSEQFETLFSDFYPKLLAYTVSILNDKQVAEDIVQEVFLYVWENRHKLQFGKGVLSYLFQTAYTRSIDYIRKNDRYEAYVRDALMDISKEYYSFLQNGCSILYELFSQDFHRELNDLLSKLPETRRKVFELVYEKGLKAREIADLMQMSQRTVESHVYLTMKYLKENMEISDFLFLVSMFSLF